MMDKRATWPADVHRCLWAPVFSGAHKHAITLRGEVVNASSKSGATPILMM